MTTIYCGVHHAGGGISGTGITLATEVSDLEPPWTFGGEKPATHCFVVISTGKDAAYRVDAGGHISITPPIFDPTAQPQWSEWTTPKIPTKLWLVPTTPCEAARAMAKAASMGGYDWLEIGSQAGVVLERIPLAKQAVHSLMVAEFIKHSVICTRLVLEVIAEAGYKFAMLDLLPERFARAAAGAFNEVEHPW